tara:strand:- start:15606 stop:16310 length:705 start_codon:yes stop_codon:yes gene_type:complete
MTSLDDLLNSSTNTNSKPRGTRTELFFKTGDEAFVTFCSKIDSKDDPLWTTVEFYEWYDQPRLYKILNADTSNIERLPAMEDRQRLNFKTRSMFGVWVYVHGIIHAQYEDGCETIEKNGKKQFVESVKDYRVLTLGYGHQGSTKYALQDIQERWNNDLTAGTIRIKREGETWQKTVYRLTDTTRTDTMPEEPNQLQPIWEYYVDHYSDIWMPSGGGDSQIEVKTQSTNDLDELF